MKSRTDFACTSVLLAATAMILVAASQPAYGVYDPKHGRWLQRDPVGVRPLPAGGTLDPQRQHLDGANLYQYCRSRPVVQQDPSGLTAGWTRRLKSGPYGLDDLLVGYRIRIEHVLPPVPEGVTQMWQVVKCVHGTLDEDGTMRVTSTDVVDIVAIAGRTHIEDLLSWRRVVRSCFAYEVCTHTTGFDDLKSGYAEQTNVQVSSRVADEVLAAMSGPKGVFSSGYVYLKKENCCSALQKLGDWAGISSFEALAIQGVGKWRYPP